MTDGLEGMLQRARAALGLGAIAKDEQLSVGWPMALALVAAVVEGTVLADKREPFERLLQLVIMLIVLLMAATATLLAARLPLADLII